MSATTENTGLLARLKPSGRKMFWAWVGYQAVKGTLTTAFIWAPMIYMWLG